MTALKTLDPPANIAALMHGIGRRAKAAARVLALAPTRQKDDALAAMAQEIRARAGDMLAANAQDLAEAKAAGASAAFVDRLALNANRVEAMANGIDTVRGLVDPVGKVAERWTRPNGMTIERVRVPLGVIGIIYESRPNVTADAAALCLKAGNAAILRGGSEKSSQQCRNSRGVNCRTAPCRASGSGNRTHPHTRAGRGRADAVGA